MDEALKKSGEYPNIALTPGTHVHAATGEAVEIPASARVDSNTRWHELFGTPERAARTLVRTSDERAVCKLPTWTASSNDYEAWLDWLRGDA